jgi:hypothetical protein
MQALVREWALSGLLEAAQAETLAADLRVDLRRTYPFLRAGLALFTVLIVAAFVGLLMEVLKIHDKIAIAALTGVAALACIALADLLAGPYRCYRFGIEEALAVASVVLLGVSAGELWPGHPNLGPLLVGAAGGYGLYRRFGFIYAALVGAICLAAIPFAYDLPQAVQRLIAAAVAGAVFVTARSGRFKFGDDYPGDEYGSLQAIAWAGVYGALNVQSPRVSCTMVYCGSRTAVTWLPPANRPVFGGDTASCWT